MATRSFLKKNNFKKFKEKFESTSFFTGSELHVEKAQAFSQAMSDFLLAELKQFEGWEESCPIALGSWARNEICPNSDIDLLFCGPEDVVFKLVSQLQENNFLIRYRVPENKEDWTQGVAGFDILALLNAQALTDEGQQVLKEQQDAILNSNSQVLRQIFKEMINERKERAQRYDSVSNYLEPNIKYGPGALRDLYQALMITRLFAAKFTEHNEVIKYLTKDALTFLWYLGLISG